MSRVALVPARSGSLRVPGKNLLPLAGHSLLAYAIAGAQESGLFDTVIVSTDDAATAEMATRYGAEVPGLRPVELAGPTSPDIEWVLHVRDVLAATGRDFDAFAILRPTSPFRTAATICRAWDTLLALGDRADSVRAVERCTQHPGKMWTLGDDGTLDPLLSQPVGETPLHSRQYQALPEVYVQNSSLEIAWTGVLDDDPPTISGRRVGAFLTDGWEGFSIDYPADVERAERALATGAATLPTIAAVSAEARA